MVDGEQGAERLGELARSVHQRMYPEGATPVIVSVGCAGSGMGEPWGGTSTRSGVPPELSVVLEKVVSYLLYPVKNEPLGLGI